MFLGTCLQQEPALATSTAAASPGPRCHDAAAGCAGRSRPWGGALSPRQVLQPFLQLEKAQGLAALQGSGLTPNTGDGDPAPQV